MENFKIIYKILKLIEKSMDYEEFDYNAISPEYLKISQVKLDNILIELKQNEFISGVNIIPIMGGNKGVKVVRPRITLKGMEYLENNEMMKKAENELKGIIYQ